MFIRTSHPIFVIIIQEKRTYLFHACIGFFFENLAQKRAARARTKLIFSDSVCFLIPFFFHYFYFRLQKALLRADIRQTILKPF